MYLSNIVNEPVENYIRATIREREPFLQELEEYAHENVVPIIQPEVAQFIRVMLNFQKPKKILEVGTAIGYSAIVFAKSAGEGCEITTVERNEKIIPIAKENIKKSGLEENITILEGDACEILKELDGEYDMIFLDAAKGQYKLFFDLTFDKLKKGGLLISDNILYKGMVASDEFAVRRKKTIIKRMRNYLDYICSSDELETSIIPIGDGVALSYKK